MSILWRPAMAIDNGIIDHDHQVLLSIINDFCELIPSIGGKVDLERTLTRLRHYTHTHLEREEHLQAQAHFPHQQGHHDEHVNLIRRLDVISQKVKTLHANVIEVVTVATPGDDLAFVDTAVEQEFVAAYGEVTTLLRSWLVDHIVKSDRLMKPYVDAMKPHSEVMPSLWKAMPAHLAPNIETPQAAKTAFFAGDAWLPARFCDERNDVLGQGGTPHAAQPHPVIAAMYAKAKQLGLLIDIDPDCRHLKDHTLGEAVSLLLGRSDGLRAPMPTAMLAFKQNAALFERRPQEDSSHSYFVRRTGEKFARIFGQIAGHMIDEVIEPRLLPRWQLLLDGVLAYGAPLRVVGLANAFGRDDLVLEGVLAPFHNGDSSEVLAMVSYEIGLG